VGRIPDEIVRQIRDSADIVDLIGRHVSLKRSGRNFKGLCPFHDEKTPSFSVNADRGFFHCFGCQEHGDAIEFVMRVENLTFPEAARSLAGQLGIRIPETDSGPRVATEPLYAAVAVAQDCYRSALEIPNNPASAYLERRGLDADTARELGIGFAPDRWDTVAEALRRKGIEPEVGSRAGVLSPRRSGGFYDTLRGRVVFPIQDVHGRVVAFGGRALSDDQQPKYLNTSETPIFRKREAFYGFPAALEAMRRTDRAVVVEGYFDQIALRRAGVQEAVATCGTALTPEHARSLRRRARRVVLLFDGDGAGRRAMARALEILLPTGLRVCAAALPAGDDPDSFLVREGADALRQLVDEAPPALEVVIRDATADGCGTPWEKSDAVASVAPLLALVPSPVERGEFCTQLALAAHTDARHVEAAVAAAARGGDPSEALPVAPRMEDGDGHKLRRLAEMLVQHPRLAAQMDAEELVGLLPRLPQSELLIALAQTAPGRDLDLHELAGRLSEEAGSLLFGLAAEDRDLPQSTAARALDDTLAWLRRRREREEQKELTRRLREPGADGAALLREKMERRRVRRDTGPATT
jgi:DNA primase